MHRIGEDRIGKDRSEGLDVVPAQLRVRVTIRPHYACRRCEEGVHQALATERAIPGGLATTRTDLNQAVIRSDRCGPPQISTGGPRRGRGKA